MSALDSTHSPQQRQIRMATLGDAGAVARIYNHYVVQSIATFEIRPVGERVIRERMRRVLANFPWLVAVDDSTVTGYAYATVWKPRAAYARSAETTVYLDPASTGRGLGSQLYGALLDDLRGRGYHSALGGIALPNPASVALHEKLGFSKVAHLREIGWKFDAWIDVGYWQLTF